MRHTAKSGATLVALGFLFVLFVLIPGETFGQEIRLSERITVDPAGEFQVTPRSFCVTEDRLFLFPDYKAGTVKVFGNDGNFLKFITAFGRNGIGQEPFGQPMYCFYNRDDAKLGIIDYGEKRVFVFDRRGKIDFRPLKDVECKSLGYDIKLAGDGEQLVVSGYIRDKGNNPYELYGINIVTGQKSYFLEAHQKYDLKTHDDYMDAYFKAQSIPAIGIKGFFDIQGDEVFFVWEGALRILKLNLCSEKKTKEIEVFGHDTVYFSKPGASELASSYVKGNFDTTVQERKRRAYVKNVFAAPGFVFLVYEIAANNEGSNGVRLRLQAYTPKGEYLWDVPIPGNPSLPMWFDKERYELYAFSHEPGSSGGEFSILKYKINN